MFDKVKPREELLKIVENINADLRLIGLDPDLCIELASDDRAEEMVDFLAQHFYPHETICKSLGTVIDEYMRQHLLERFNDNLSLLLVSRVSNKIIGVRTITVLPTSEGSSNLESIQNENVRIARTFLQHKSAEMDVYKYFSVDDAIHFINLVIHKDHRNRGLASLLMKGALQFAKDIGLEPACVTGEGTSNYAQKIYEKFGFEVLHTVKYEDYKVNGEVVIKNTGANQTCKFYIKKL